MKRVLLPILCALVVANTFAGDEQENSSPPPAAPETNTVAKETNSPPVLTPVTTNATDVTTTNITATDTNAPPDESPGSRPATAESPRSASRVDYYSFRIISERNIFNPNRTARSNRYVRREREPERRATRTESIALLGTMSYEKGRYAFFEGSSSQFQQVLKTSDTIGGLKIADITPNHVKLEPTNGPPLELPVGMQIRRQDDGEWKVSERSESSGGYTRSSSSSSSSSNGAGSDEVLKRLMQKRDQDGSGEATTNAEPSASVEERTEKTEPTEPAPPPAAEKPAPAGADDILKRLMQKREQELNK